MCTVYLLVLCAVAVIAAPQNENRIIGGSITTISSYPHAVPLLYGADLINYGQSCGGTIISQRSVLSAAHCFHDQRNNTLRWRIRVGSSYALSGGTVHNVNQIIINPNYIRTTIDSDVAILRSATNFNYIANLVQAASIAGSTYNLADNQIVWAAGWGTTETGLASEQLRHVQVWTVNQDVCKQRYASVGSTVTDNMLCSGWLDVGGRDQCQGDSGGPLYHNNVVVGICSWGRGCAQAYYPGVNARVSRFATWIQANA